MRRTLRLMLRLIIAVCLKTPRALWLMLCRLCVMIVLRPRCRRVRVRPLIQIISMLILTTDVLVVVLLIFAVLVIVRPLLTPILVLRGRSSSSVR